jgi:hypothetical protein
MNRDTLSGTQLAIVEQCDFIAELLLEKNRKYGDSALNPVRIFSSSDPVEQINVRIDDKLSRIASNQADDEEDAELDLIGYLVLKRVALRQPRDEAGQYLSHPEIFAEGTGPECSDFRPQRPGQVGLSYLETLRKGLVPNIPVCWAPPPPRFIKEGATPIPDLATLCNRRGGVGGVNT